MYDLLRLATPSLFRCSSLHPPPHCPPTLPPCSLQTPLPIGTQLNLVASVYARRVNRIFWSRPGRKLNRGSSSQPDIPGASSRTRVVFLGCHQNQMSRERGWVRLFSAAQHSKRPRKFFIVVIIIISEHLARYDDGLG